MGDWPISRLLPIQNSTIQENADIYPCLE
jgi:hypothetical protein